MTSQRVAIYYQARTQHENLGDRGIARAQLSFARGFGDVVVNARGCPRDYVEELSGDGYKILDCHPLAFLFKMVVSDASKNVLLMKPGHFYGLDGGLKGRLAQTLALAFIRMAGVEIYRYGASIGPFAQPIARLERLVSRMYKKYTLREGVSLKYAEGIGIKTAEFFPDWAFVLSERFAGQMEPLAGPYLERSTLLTLSFRETACSNFEDVVSNVCDSIVDMSCKSGPEICYVTQVKRDRENNSSLMKTLGHQEAQHVVYGDKSADQILAVYRNSRLVVSNRLHVLLFAAHCGALPIGVVSADENGKIVGIFESIGMQDLLLRLDTAPHVSAQLNYIIENEVSLRRRWDVAVHNARTRMNEHFQAVFGA